MSELNLIQPSKKPRFTLFVPWTRLEFADRVLQNINDMYLPRDEMEVVFYVDTDDKELWNRLNNWALLNQFAYNGMKLVKSGNGKPETYSPIPRRARIVQMKEDSKQYIEASELVFGLEDDTQTGHHAFEILLEDYNSQEDVKFVQGVQQGRWGMTVLGAWRLNDLENPTQVKTVPFEHKTDVVEVDGGGFFCYLTDAELYRQHEYYWHDECFGPDMTYGVELRKKGYTCLMDYRLICEHYTQQGMLIPTPQNTIVGVWNKEGARWIQKTQ